jgi:hypothetical protein
MDPTNAIPLDDDLKAKLGKFDRPVEVKDEYGRVVGTFVPQRQYGALLAWWAAPYPTPEQREAERKGPGVPASVINDMLLERMKR